MRSALPSPSRLARRGLALAALAGLAAPLGAQVAPDGVAVHGYGGWGYGRTTANDTPNFYNFAHKRGDYSHAEFALNVSVAVDERLQITAQPFWHQGHHANQTASGVDYAFAEWRFSDAVRFRAGLVKHPFGIYTEVFDVGTLRPFVTLPQSVYGPVGMVGKAYSGVGLTGAAFSRGGWEIGYDVYAGGLEVAERDAALQVAAEGLDTLRALNLGVSKTFRDVAGGRVVVQTPLTGLSVGVSGYSGTRPTPSAEVRRTVGGVHAEYLTDVWSARAEATRQTEDDALDRSVDGAYVEVARFVTERWQVAGQYSTLRTSLDAGRAAAVGRAPQLLRHDEWGAGVNHWFTTGFALKASYHAVRGNRLAGPEQPGLRAAVARGLMPESTGALLLGAALSF